MKTKKEIKVFIVEDNEVYAKALQGFLMKEISNINMIKIFSVGEMCILELRHKPDIIIVDYFLNSKIESAKNGLEIIKYIKLKNPEIYIIVLSSQEDYDVVFKAIKQYDCFYVQKDSKTYTKVAQLIKNFNFKKHTELVK